MASAQRPSMDYLGTSRTTVFRVRLLRVTVRGGGHAEIAVQRLLWSKGAGCPAAD
jgi:hypothetical protein